MTLPTIVALTVSPSAMPYWAPVEFTRYVKSPTGPFHRTSMREELGVLALRGLERDPVARAAVRGEVAAEAHLDLLVAGLPRVDGVHDGLHGLRGPPGACQQGRSVGVGRPALVTDREPGRRRNVMPVEPDRLSVDPVPPLRDRVLAEREDRRVDPAGRARRAGGARRACRA